MASKSAARRLIAEGGAYLNNRKVTDAGRPACPRRPAARPVPRAAARQAQRGRRGGRPGLSVALVRRRARPAACPGVICPGCPRGRRRIARVPIRSRLCAPVGTGISRWVKGISLSWPQRMPLNRTLPLPGRPGRTPLSSQNSPGVRRSEARPPRPGLHVLPRLAAKCPAGCPARARARRRVSI